MTISQRERVRVEPGQKRIRAYLGGVVVADTTTPTLVWELPYFPTYYFPAADVAAGVLAPSDSTVHSPSRGDARVFDVRAGGKTAVGGAAQFAESPIEALRELVRFDWDAMDAWFEEDEEVFVHPRDPHTRIDVLGSSRHVEVTIGGVKVADSHQPRLLFETGLPALYYLPLTDVRMDLLRPSDTESRCPYKGTASYWSVVIDGTVHEDVLWTYRAPLPESQKVAGLVCFYNERVDTVIDGVAQERPNTKFS